MDTTGSQPGEAPGRGPDDEVKGGHPDVVVSGDRAFLFYFTHPGRRAGHEKEDGYEQRRSSIQVAELEFREGSITCDRDKPVYINFSPEAQSPGQGSYLVRFVADESSLALG